MTQFTISHDGCNAGSGNMPISHLINSIGYNTQSLHNSPYTLLPKGYTLMDRIGHTAGTRPHWSMTRDTQAGIQTGERMGTGEGGDELADVKICDLLHNSVKFFENEVPRGC
jgi:hypothetical protein